MSDLTNILQKIETRLRLLAPAENESEQILKTNKPKKKIENHLPVIEQRLSEIRELQTTVQKIKIEQQERVEDVVK